MNWQYSIDELVELVGECRVVGHYSGQVTEITDLRIAEPGSLSFLGSKKYAQFLVASEASVVLVPEDMEGSPSVGQTWIHVQDPSLALAAVCGDIEKSILPRPEAGIHPTAIVDPGASIDPTATVGPYCIIFDGAVIGKNTLLEAHVRVERGATLGSDTYIHQGTIIGWGSQVGDRCILFPGVVLGADGFGYHTAASGHTRLPQIGIVVIEDDVEIGAHSCIDRARFAETRVGQGTKIDNLVQVGHNVLFGKHCMVCAQVGIAGSAEFGNFVTMAGQVGVSGHLKVGDHVTATGQTGITKSIPPGTVLSGTPCRPHREELKRLGMINKIPNISQRLKALEEAKL